MELTNIHGRSFRLLLTPEQIAARVAEVGAAITADYSGKNPVFLAVLSGSFIFAADLVRQCPISCEVVFVKLASYTGMQSTGTVSTHLGIQADLRGRHVIVVEDIVDSGRTLASFLPEVQSLGVASLEVASLLLKPAAMTHPVNIRYLGFELPEDFLVGYGLDYDGLGRNLPGIYVVE